MPWPSWLKWWAQTSGQASTAFGNRAHIRLVRHVAARFRRDHHERDLKSARIIDKVAHFRRFARQVLTASDDGIGLFDRAHIHSDFNAPRVDEKDGVPVDANVDEILRAL